MWARPALESGRSAEHPTFKATDPNVPRKSKYIQDGGGNNETRSKKYQQKELYHKSKASQMN